MKKIFILIAIILFSSIDDANAQRRRRRRSRANKPGKSVMLRHEIGGNIGASNFQGDFTPEGPGDGLIGINGFSINATHSMHFLPKRRSSKFLRHLVLKSNLGYTTGNFDNLGLSTGKEPLAGTSADHSHILLGRLTSEAKILSFGTQVEYYFKDFFNYMYRGRSRRYRNRRGRSSSKGNMYIALGLGVNKINSSFNYDVPNPNILPDNYTPEVFGGIDSVIFSGSGALGYRYKIARSLDLVTELKVNYYLSDRVDAINTDPATNIQNQFNDYNSVLSLGVIYHLF